MNLKNISSSILSIGLLFSTFPAWAESALRVVCSDANSGVVIYINDENKGTCEDDQLTFFLQAGDIELRAVKNIDNDHERTFRKTFYLSNDSVKKVTINLSRTQLTEEAVTRIAREKRIAEKDVADRALNLAREGDVTAMKRVAGLFAKGIGIEKDAENAQYWLDKAEFTRTLKLAKAGNIEATDKLIGLYQTGKGVKKSATKVKEWQATMAETIQKQKEAKAAIVLKEAELGSIDAMRSAAQRYRYGNGVSKNNNIADEWRKKADAAEQHQAEMAIRAKRRQAIEVQLAGQDGMANVNGLMKTMQDRPDIGILRSVSVSMLPIMSTLDLIASPTRRAKVNELKRELESLAATWETPNSMVAKAYHDTTR